MDCPKFTQILIWPMQLRDRDDGTAVTHYDLAALGEDGCVYRWDRKNGEFYRLPAIAREWSPENPHAPEFQDRRQFGRR